MPPSPQEIKARLDSAVDEEGNVLNMAVVLEVVSILEKIPISKEALETTRIGRVINLMRKKTANEELAKRAKKLVKKWQKLVSNHFKNLKATDSPQSGLEAGRITPTINGVIKTNNTDSASEGQQKTTPDLQRKTSLKRKRTEHSPHPLICENHSSLKSVSFQDNSRDDINLQSPRKNGSDRCQSSDNDGSELNTHTNTNATIVNEVSCVANPSVTDPVKLVTESPTKSLNVSTEHQSSEPDKPSLDSIVIEAPQQQDETKESKSLVRTDLRPQDTESCPPPTNDFNAIEPENLSLNRLPLPDRHLDPFCEADGVSGCYHNERFYHWTDVICRNDGELTILPYVNLE